MTLPMLTARQTQCVDALIAGKTPVEIAREIGCSLVNVHQVLRSARGRTGLKTREALAVWWSRNAGHETYMRARGYYLIPGVAA